jgi:hypothetical protein
MKVRRSRLTTGCLGTLLLLSVVGLNLLWSQKAAVDKQLEEARRKSYETTLQLKNLREQLASAQTQQEAEHAQAQSLSSKLKELEVRQANIRQDAGSNLPSSAAASRGEGGASAAAPNAVGGAPVTDKSAAGTGSEAAPTAALAAEAVSVRAAQVVPIIVFACCRRQYLERTLDTLFARIPQKQGVSFEVWVSQDGEDPGVKTLLETKYASPRVRYLQHIDHSPLGKSSPGELDSYYKIARHYGWGFGQLFADPRYSWAIVLEDDLEVWAVGLRVGFDGLRDLGFTV